MSKTKKSKMISVELYFLLDDYTWNTDFIDVPENIVHDEKAIIDWAYENVKLHEDVAIIGVYNNSNEEEA